MSDEKKTEALELTLSQYSLVMNHLENLEEEAEAQIQQGWGMEGFCTYDMDYHNQPVYS